MSSISLTSPQLSINSLNSMINCKSNEDYLPKTLQIIEVKSDANVGPNDGYYSALINDGLVKHQCLLNRYNCLNIEQFDENCLIKVNEYMIHFKLNQNSSVFQSPSTSSSTSSAVFSPTLILQDFTFLVSGKVVGRELQYEDKIEDNIDEDLGNDNREELMDANNNNVEHNGQQTDNNLNVTLLQTPNRRRTRNTSQTQTNTPSKDFTLIKNLSANELYKRYNLKGKIINVFPVQNYNKKTNENAMRMGFVFSDDFDLICGTVWDKAITQMKATLIPGHYVRMSKVTVSVNPSNNEKSLNLNSEAVVTPDSIKFKYKTFIDFENLKNKIGKKVDVIGIIVDYIIGKPNSKLKHFKLRNKNGFIITVSLRDKTAQHFGGNKGSVLAIKNAFVVNENNIRSITFSETKCIIDPKTPEASLLK